MWKYLAIFAVIFCLTVFVTYKDQDHADRADQHTSGPNNARVPAVADNTHPAENKENSQRNFPRWHRFFAWPEGITAWAIFLTLMAIAEQTKETAKAAKASQKSAEAALVQLNQTTAMERARVEVRIGPLNINLPERPKGLRPETRIPSAPCWSLTTNILLRNIGAGRAFITRSGGRLDVVPSDAPPPDIDDVSALILPDLFLDPAPSQTPAPLYFWPGVDDGLPEDLRIFGKSLDETLRIRVYGFIEYETMGKRMHHDFWYTKSNAFLGLFAILGGEVPMPEMERLTQIGWIATGNFEEYEIKASTENPN